MLWVGGLPASLAMPACSMSKPLRAQQPSWPTHAVEHAALPLVHAGADYYESRETRAQLKEEGRIPIGVGVRRTCMRACTHARYLERAAPACMHASICMNIPHWGAMHLNCGAVRCTAKPHSPGTGAGWRGHPLGEYDR